MAPSKTLNAKTLTSAEPVTRFGNDVGELVKRKWNGVGTSKPVKNRMSHNILSINGTQ